MFAFGPFVLAFAAFFALLIGLISYVNEGQTPTSWQIWAGVGFFVAVGIFPLLVWFTSQVGASAVALGIIGLTSLMIVARHHENIRRLMAGTENRMGSKRAEPGI